MLTPLPSVAWSRLVLVLVHIPVVAFPAAYTLLNVAALTPPNTHPVPPVTLCLVLGALQLRHSLAVARGERPRAGVWTLLAMVVPVYAPMLWFGYFNWQFAPTLLVASAPMVLRGRLGFVVGGAVAVLGGFLSAMAGLARVPQPPVAYIIGLILNTALLDVLIGVFLYGAARLVRLVDELHATRSDLAELAVGRERLRVSRDLHDLLGQSLSAISLKGDLAIRLLRSDTQAAHDEIQGLTAVARDAMRGVRAVAHEEPTVSLRQETDGAAALLAAAGIATTVDVDPADLPAPVESTMAWAVREGVANVLLHSAARSCSIVAARHNGMFCLEIVNDGARERTGEGHGLAGLATRATALAGTVVTEHDDGRFSLLVRIPEGGTTR